MIERYRIEIAGIVQGVGFRPFVFSLAESLKLSGWVYNHAAGVSIEIQGEADDCRRFLEALSVEKPSLARIDSIQAEKILLKEGLGFEIRESKSGEKGTLLSPDMAICQDCLDDLRNPEDRHYRYAFTNCTNCGPRFTIIEDLPYDRPMTTMRHFSMCGDCAEEYKNPKNRRFHAQPVACPACGPSLSFFETAGEELPGDPLSLAKDFLRQGKILAIKGLGGYHLACDAKNDAAVSTLRGRKYRWDKPFAVMLENLSLVRACVQLSPEEEALLCSQRAPIVLLRKMNQPKLLLSPSLAPGNARLGVMLPYTPLHHLLMEGMEALLMTSANISDEPIAFEDADAFQRLSSIADAFLTHNRPIFRRCDDSVAIYAAAAPRLIRRSRGYAPEPIFIPDCGHSILSCGGEQKNTFCLSRGGQAFLSQHIGDMQNLATMESFSNEIRYFSNMFAIKPDLIAYDLHPDYLASRYARNFPEPCRKIPVQHHHAHMASVLAEHACPEKAIGLIFDGSGYGTDGNIWGGEILIGDCSSFQRIASLLELPLPGGELAIREPWRLGLSAVAQAFPAEELESLLPECIRKPGWQLLLQATKKGINAPLATSMGRLFDAAAALAGIGSHVNYEGQAAVELEQILCEEEDAAYHFEIIEPTEGRWLLDWRPLIREEIRDLAQGVSPGRISARFHRAVIQVLSELCEKLRNKLQLDLLVFSGGCWQNVFLLENSVIALEEKGFRVLLNEQVPCNDGGLSYGQAAVAAAQISGGMPNVFGDSRNSRKN